jgi:hypothetical protein
MNKRESKKCLCSLNHNNTFYVKAVFSFCKSEVNKFYCSTNAQLEVSHKCGTDPQVHRILLLLSSASPLCRISTLIFLRQTVSLGNTVL